MKRFYSLAILLSALFLSSCSSAPQGDSAFLSAADDFIAAFNSKNTAALDKYIDKEYGFFVIHNPGAYVVAKYYDSFSSIMSGQDNDIFRLKDDKFTCTSLRRGLEPVYSCDEDKWNKEGCFYGTEKNKVASQVYRDMKKYDLVFGDEVDEYIRKAEASEKNYTYFMYNTDEFIGFYFGMKNGKYYLIAVDIVVPCSA